MTRRIHTALQWLCIANLALACVLLIGGDVKNALLGLAGSAFFGLALLVSELATASSRYYAMLWAVSRKHEGEERHETALRYIRERDAAPSSLARIEAGTDETRNAAQPTGQEPDQAPKGTSHD